VKEELEQKNQEKLKMRRRTLMKWFIGIGAVSSIGAMGSVLVSVRPSQLEQSGNQPEAGDRLVFATGGNKGQPLTRDSILQGQAALAFPEGKEEQNNLVMVLHTNPAGLREPTLLDGAPEGFVAYSAICTHLGCTVNFAPADAEHDGPEIHCPCHAGMFDALAGAGVISGPVPRALPQLPLELGEDGALAVAGPFDSPVGVL